MPGLLRANDPGTVPTRKLGDRRIEPGPLAGRTDPEAERERQRWLKRVTPLTDQINPLKGR